MCIKFAVIGNSRIFATLLKQEVIGRLAQLVQSICLTSRGSAVRIRQRPHEQKSPMRLITKEIIIGYELMRFASARPFLSNGSYLSLFKCK